MGKASGIIASEALVIFRNFRRLSIEWISKLVYGFILTISARQASGDGIESYFI